MKKLISILFVFNLIFSVFCLEITEEKIYISDSKGNIFRLNMKLDDAYFILGKPKSVINLWGEDNRATKAFYSANYPNKGIKINYFDDVVEEICVTNSDYYFSIDNMKIQIGSSITKVREIFGEGEHNYMGESKKISYSLLNQEDYKLTLLFEPKTEKCISISISKNTSKSFIIAGVNGNEFYLGMPVSVAIQKLGTRKSIENLWAQYESASTAYYLDNYEDASITYFDIDMKLDSFTTDSSNYFLKDLNIGIGSDLFEVYNILGMKTTRERNEFDEKRNKTVRRLIYSLPMEDGSDEFNLNLVFDYESNKCIYFSIIRNK